MTSEENVKQKANENRKAEERILGLMKAGPAPEAQSVPKPWAFWVLGIADILETTLEGIDAAAQDKDSNEKEIKERDKTIADKEQRIFDLKKQSLSCTDAATRWGLLDFFSRFVGVPASNPEYGGTWLWFVRTSQVLLGDVFWLWSAVSPGTKSLRSSDLLDPETSGA